MGQLERYGLYVLCLVIFLILGVAIWGSDPRELPGHTLVTTDKTVKVKTRDEHHTDVITYAKEQVKKSLKKHEDARDEMFQRAQSPDRVVADISDKPPMVEIKTAEVPKQAPEEVVTEHIIAQGDNFSSLAQSYLKDENLYHQIAAANPNLNPKRLRIGARVVIPKRVVRSKRGSVGASGDTHKVRAGESLWLIAKKYVGAGKADAYSRRIIKLNGISDPLKLSRGRVIKLPSR